jgi:hypothetical protein
MSSIQEENMSYSSKISVRKRHFRKTPSSQVNKKVKTEEQSHLENVDRLNEINEDYLNHMRCDENLEEDLKETLVCFKEKTPILPPPCHCVKCFVYMGEMNPRQYCRKIRCEYDFLNEKEMLQIKVFHLRSSSYYIDSAFDGYVEYHASIQAFINSNYIKDLENSD